MVSNLGGTAGKLGGKKKLISKVEKHYGPHIQSTFYGVVAIFVEF